MILMCSLISSNVIFFKLQITFTEFHLESSVNCSNDYVLVRNGLSINSPVIGRYCGDVKPKEIRAQTHEALIEFHTNLNTVSQGFRIDVIPVSSGKPTLQFYMKNLLSWNTCVIHMS